MTPIGHLAIGFAAKPYVARVHLGILLVATWVLDFIYIGLAIIAGEPFGSPNSIYKVWSHSLLMAVVLSSLTGLVAAWFYRNARAAAGIGLLAFSHWVLDFIMWDDLPLALDSSPQLGLGLLKAAGVGAVLSIELGMMITGVTLYILHRRHLKRVAGNR